MSPGKKFVDETPKLASGEHDLTFDPPKVHYLPFKVGFQGPADISSRFTQGATPHPEHASVSCNHFRGRLLLGTKLDLDYVAFLAEAEPQHSKLQLNEETESDDDDEKEETTLAAAGQPIHLRQCFKDVTYWEFDKVPSSMDSIAKLQDWLKLASVLHEPIKN